MEIRKDKKGATGATITWIVALFIISFILFVFILTTLVITKDKDGISISKETSIEDDLILSSKLITFLNMPAEIDKEKKIIDIITEKNEEEAKREAQKFIDSLELKEECYIFQGKESFDRPWGSFSEKVFEVRAPKGFPGWMNLPKPFDSFLEKNSFKMKFISEEGKEIKLRLYVGSCEIQK